MRIGVRGRAVVVAELLHEGAGGRAGVEAPEGLRVSRLPGGLGNAPWQGGD